MLDTIIVLGVLSFAIGYVIWLFKEDWMWRLIANVAEFVGFALLWIVYQYGFSIAQGEEYLMGFTAATLLVFFLALYIIQWLVAFFRALERF